MVFGYRAALHTLRYQKDPPPEGSPCSCDDPVSLPETTIDPLWKSVRRLMQRNVGIVRTTAELEKTRRELAQIRKALRREPNTVAAWETKNIATVGSLIVESALHRHESRGLHYILDYPDLIEAERHDTVLDPNSLTL